MIMQPAMPMQASYGQIPCGSPWGQGGANVISMEGGGAGMPPSPGTAAFSTKDSGAIQQKMARQRQLALERRRAAGRQLGGCMAQANQLPVSQVQAKAPGWDRVLCEGIDKPGSLAEKAEAAFNDAKKSVVKTSNVMEKVEESFKVEPESQGPVKPSGCPEKTMSGLLEEIEDFDVLDVEVPKGDAPKPVLIQKGGEQTEQSKGWNLETEPSTAPMQQAPAPAEQDAPQSRWYKPSTWRKGAPASAAPSNGISNDIAPAPANTEVQRIGLKTPPLDSDWSVGPTFNSPHGPARRRPRRPIAESPPPTTQPAVDLDAMMCPGAIFDDQLPVTSVPAVKAQSNPKHTSGGVDRAAFPTEARTVQAQPRPVQRGNAEMQRQVAEQEAELQRIQADRAREMAAKPKAPAPTSASTSAPTSRLAQLEAQKKDAIGREDFMEAQRIKGEIEKLQSQPQQSPSPSPTKDDDSNIITQIETVQEVEEPSAQPAPEGLRKRFWKPFQQTPAPTAGNSAEVSAFDMNS